MDFLEFLSRSEWPLVVGSALWLLRYPLQRMLDRVNPSKIDAWGFKAEFQATLAKVEQLISTEEIPGITANLAKQDASVSSSENVSHISMLASISPQASILESWRLFETEMRRMSDAGRPIPPGFKGPYPIRIEAAGKQLGLGPDDIAALMELRRLRNSVAHATNALVSEDDAKRFSDTITYLLKKLTAAQTLPDKK